MYFIMRPNSLILIVAFMIVNTKLAENAYGLYQI